VVILGLPFNFCNLTTLLSFNKIRTSWYGRENDPKNKNLYQNTRYSKVFDPLSPLFFIQKNIKILFKLSVTHNNQMKNIN
jgi:hypothetical protein